MELVSILHLLVRRWPFVLAGAVVALTVGLMAGILSSGSAARSGIAEARALVDTHRSYTDDLHGGTERLDSQAALLTALLADEPQRRAIARAAGIAADRLDVLAPQDAGPQIPSTLARSLATLVDEPREPYAIRVTSALSIVTIEAAAPSAPVAARLARAASDTLAAMTAARAPSAARALVVTPLGSVRSVELTPSGGHGALLGLGATLATFALWCCAIVIAAGLARAWRAAAPAASVRSRGSSSAAA
ncbi:MAG: hypothetical protein QOJ63_2344 [Solirubrobacteraceae bacterium]|nr:hypothetical protein [Solirubrobacteraceae bacterium]